MSSIRRLFAHPSLPPFGPSPFSTLRGPPSVAVDPFSSFSLPFSLPRGRVFLHPLAFGHHSRPYGSASSKASRTKTKTKKGGCAGLARLPSFFPTVPITYEKRKFNVFFCSGGLLPPHLDPGSNSAPRTRTLKRSNSQKASS